MKKLSLILIIALMALSSGITAQIKIAEQEYTVNYDVMSPDANRMRERPQKIRSNDQKEQIVIYENTFDDLTEWDIVDEGVQGTWTYFPDETGEMDFYGSLASISANDGWVGFDAFPFFSAPEGELLQDSYIELTEPIDCSGQPVVFLSVTQEILTWVPDQQIIEVSNDGGFSWAQFVINDQYEPNEPSPSFVGEVSVDISSAAANEEEIFVRFRWQSIPDVQGGGYGWSLDDLIISGPIENDLSVVTAFFSDNFETYFEDPENPGFFGPASAETTEFEIVNSAAYHTQPSYSAKPFNFGVIVENIGTVTQTGVQAQVLFEDPLGNVQADEMLLSDPITLAPGDRDTLRIYDVVPTAWADTIPGLYFMDFEVFADLEDLLPLNNFGPTRTTRIRNDSQEDGAWIQSVNSGLISFLDINNNHYLGTRFAFTNQEANERVITHIDFALTDDTEAAGVGQFMIFNVRKEGVLFADPEDPAVNALFPYDAEEEGVLLYQITPETELMPNSIPIWNRYELPTPILIEDGVIHQAEVRLLNYGSDAVFFAFGDRQNSGLSVIYDPTVPADGWGIFGTADIHLRFGTEMLSTVNTVTYESGVKLVQNYPNPVVDNTQIQYQLDEASEVTFEVFDITGRLVHSQDLGNVPANVSQYVTFNRGDLASGTYTYSLVTGDERASRKMIIE